ncbi:MAG: DUF6468 domain-containing protein [Rhodospirillales bacterium]
MPFSLALDVLVAVLLVITIGYAMVLNRRLGRLRRDKSELEKLAATFGQATARAEESIGTLKKTADALKERIDNAQALRDDLAFLIDRGGSAADRLEETVRAARKEGGSRPRSGLKKPAAVQGNGKINPKSTAERDLIKALQAAR